LPEKTAERQRDSGANRCQENFRQKLYVRKNLPGPRLIVPFSWIGKADYVTAPPQKAETNKQIIDACQEIIKAAPPRGSVMVHRHIAQ